MSTKIYLHAATATPTVGTDSTHYADTSPGAVVPASATTYVTSTVTGPTAPIQTTTTGGGAALTWISAPISNAVTIAGTATINIRAKVDNAAANATVEGQILRLDSGGNILSTVVAVPPVTIPSSLTTSDAAINYTATPSSTAFSVGDLIGFRIFIDDGNAATMATGHTVTISIDAGQGLATAGDTWIQFTEQVIMQLSGQLDGYSIADLSNTERSKTGYLWPSPNIPGVVVTYKMRATDTTLVATVYWIATIIDSTGSQYTGPGPLTNIVRVS